MKCYRMNSEKTSLLWLLDMFCVFFFFVNIYVITEIIRQRAFQYCCKMTKLSTKSQRNYHLWSEIWCSSIMLIVFVFLSSLVFIAVSWNDLNSFGWKLSIRFVFKYQYKFCWIVSFSHSIAHIVHILMHFYIEKKTY